MVFAKLFVMGHVFVFIAVVVLWAWLTCSASIAIYQLMSLIKAFFTYRFVPRDNMSTIYRVHEGLSPGLPLHNRI